LSELSEGALLLLVAFLLVNAPNCHLLLVLASVVQGDAVNCNTRHVQEISVQMETMKPRLSELNTDALRRVLISSGGSW